MNPIDAIQFYSNKTEGFVLGSDGSGTIAAVGEGLEPSIIGKKVAFLGEAWSQYKVTDTKNLVWLDEAQDLSKAANSIINPVTVLAQLSLAHNNGSKAALINAGAS